MVDTLKPALALAASMAAVLFTVATPALSQAPTDAQRSAIRSECRSDYEAHCASVPPGGMASLQCLQKNMSSLSSGCQTAVRAVEAPAEPKTETKTETKTEPKTESAPAAATAKPATDTKLVPQRLSEKLRRRADRRRRGAELPGKEQGEPLAKLSEGRQRGRRWRANGRNRRRSGGGGDRQPRSRGGAGARAGAAADAAARGTIRFEVGMRWRCSRAVRKCCARRRPHPAMPGDAGSLAFPRMQGRSGPVRCPVNCPPVEGSSPANQTVDP
jgi:hypothetical protein